ncbi:acyltransferase family protein [uncultured Methylobacterium sp.]|uniref:acyltransferase family protein n=1 Tax=uncultured Methylobacterium sp. TaxID=157278 RepID=UPI0035C95A89
MSDGTDAPTRAPARRLDAVQVLRAVAAGMVVLLHAQAVFALQGEARGLWMPQFTALPLGAGVDLFFVISGFIIVYASEGLFGADGGGLVFLRRRLLRVVPLYWFALSLRLAVLLAGAAAGTMAAPGFAAVATSYLFIPFDALGYGPRYPFPILDLGWTLNYEVMFYVLFACGIAVARSISRGGRETAGLLVVGVLAAAVVAAWCRPPAIDQVWFWFQPIVLEFAAGIGLALLFQRGVRLGRVTAGLLCGLGVLVWATIDVAWFDPMSGPAQYGWPRALIWGGGAALVFAGLVFGPFRFDHPVLRRLVGIGDASYALYLLHPFVFLAAKVILPALPLRAGLLWPLTVLMVAVSVLATLAFHRRAEAPAIRWLQRNPPDAILRRFVRRAAPASLDPR